jgi:hypothetical protein
MHPKADTAADRRGIELLDAEGLARKLGASSPEELARMTRWLKRQARPSAKDPIPHIRFGLAPRFEWGSPGLNAWIDRRRQK